MNSQAYKDGSNKDGSKEIQNVNEELQFLGICLSDVRHGQWDEGYVKVVERIIDREKSLLVELKSFIIEES